MKRNELNRTSLRRIIRESIGRVLTESSDAKAQWDKEKRIFLRGLKNGNAFVDNGMVAVQWGRDETDPRYICFRFGDNKLTDDHFYVQSSPNLTRRSLKNIYQILSSVYGVDVSEYLYDEDMY